MRLERFISKIVVKLLDCRNEAPDKQYELNGHHRFSEDYIQAIDDVFFYINKAHPDLAIEHSKSGYRKIRFREYYWEIDVLDPSATPITKYSGDSAGVAIFLCLMSAFHEFEINDSHAITGSLRSRNSTEIGLVGDIPGKLKGILELGVRSRIRDLFIPDIDHLLSEEFINKEDISGIINEVKKLESLKDPADFLAEAFFPQVKKCRTLREAFIRCALPPTDFYRYGLALDNLRWSK